MEMHVPSSHSKKGVLKSLEEKDQIEIKTTETIKEISFLTSKKKLISKTKPADQTERIQAHQKDATEKLQGNNTHTPKTPKPNSTTSQ